MQSRMDYAIRWNRITQQTQEMPKMQIAQLG